MDGGELVAAGTDPGLLGDRRDVELRHRVDAGSRECGVRRTLDIGVCIEQGIQAVDPPDGAGFGARLAEQRALPGGSGLGIGDFHRKGPGLEQAIDVAIAQFIKEGPTEEELELAKNAMIASYVYSADNQAGLAQRYGSNLVIGRTIADIEEWPDRVAKVTAADVKKVAAKYLVLETSVTGFLIPQSAADEGTDKMRGEVRQ